MARWGAVWILTATLGAGVLTAQPEPRFEVASIKPNRSELPVNGGAGGGTIGRRGQRFVATNATLRDIVRYAFELEPFHRIENGSGLLNNRYDISATIPESDTPVDSHRAMLRTLLRERFELSARREAREQAVFALVFARADKRLGPSLKLSATDCSAVGAVTTATALDNFAKGIGPSCDMVYQPYRARLAGGARSMADFVRLLSRLPTLGAPVVDRTGLTGLYDFDLTYSAASLAAGAEPLPLATEESHRPLFAAIQEQLGLKLESTRGPVDVLVIDSIRQPTEN